VPWSKWTVPAFGIIPAVVTITVADSASVHDLADSIVDALIADGVVTLEAQEPHAVNQAIKGITIARTQMVMRALKLVFRAGLMNPRADWNTGDGVRLVVSTE